MSKQASKDGDELIRAIDTKALSLNVINMVVGGGIFLLPGIVAVHLGSAAITVAMVDTLSLAVPALGDPIPRGLFIIALVAFLATVNIRGVKSGVRLFVFNTVVKLVPLLLLLIVGLFAINFEYLAIPDIPSFASIGAAAVVLFFAFAGAESALSASGEIKKTRRKPYLSGCLLASWAFLRFTWAFRPYHRAYLDLNSPTILTHCWQQPQIWSWEIGERKC